MIRFRDFVDKAIAGLGIAVLIALLTTVSLGIITRGLGNPFTWTDELSGFLMVWLSCLGWMIATRRGAHIRIRFFQDRLPGLGKRGFEILIQAALALFGIIIAAGGVHLVQVNHDIEAISMPLSTAWMYAPLVPAGIVTFLQALFDLWQQMARAPAPDTQGTTA